MPSERPKVEDLITLHQAADIAGYTDQHSLSQAIRRGSLKGVRIRNARPWFTTRAWLEDYIAHRPTNARHEAERLRRKAERRHGE